MKPTVKQAFWEAKCVDCEMLPAKWSEWVKEQATGLGPAWLLAFSLEGAAWGVISKEGSIQLADTLFPCKVLDLGKCALQELYVFSKDGQAHAWIEDGNWKAVLITDSPTVKDSHFDQEILLWGTRCPDENWKSPFALLEEGTQGMRQAIPLDNKPDLTASRDNAPRLKVRHYLGQSPQNGAAVVAVTRLVELIG